MFQLSLSTRNVGIGLEEEEGDHQDAVNAALHVAHENHSLPSQANGGSAARTPKSRGRSVRFHKIHRCKRFQRYTEEEILDVWFQSEDYAEIKQAYAFTVFMMDAGCPSKVEDDENTTRGLEKRSEEGAWKRYQRKSNYYNSVLDEQDRQWENDEDDQELIAQVAKECCMEASLEAFDYGVRDEWAVYGVRKGNQKSFARQLQSQEEDASCDDTVSTFPLSRGSSLCSSDSNGSWPPSGDSSEAEDAPLEKDDCYHSY